jgi:putative intracellular protease/amidase
MTIGGAPRFESARTSAGEDDTPENAVVWFAFCDEAVALDAAGEAWVDAAPPWTGRLVSPESARAGSGRARPE